MYCKLLDKTTGFEFVAEYRFCSERRFRFDFACIEKKIAIEIEGGVFTNGRHTRGTGYINDMEKYNLAQELGWKVFRYTPSQQFTSDAIDQVKRVINQNA